MKFNFLGKTGLKVSELCFGTMTFGDKGYWSAIAGLQQESATELIKGAIDGGINFIDTANIYSYGESETLLGQALNSLGVDRNELVIATKLRGRMKEGANNVGLSRFHIFNSVNESLQRLQLEHIDLLYVHGVDPATDIEETMHSLNDVVMSGKVRYVGVCNWPAWMVMKANMITDKRGWHGFKAMQYYYSIAGRDIEHDVLPVAKDLNIGVMPWSPLAGGFLSGKYSREADKAGGRRDNFDFPPVNKEKAYDIIDLMTAVAREHNASVAEVALAWVRMQPGVTSTIIGAKKLEQLKANIKSTELHLTADNLRALQEISAQPKPYPGWMAERQASDR